MVRKAETMGASNIPNPGPAKKARFLPLWQAYPLALFVWDVLPWAISLLTPHYGWTAGHPGAWNLVGLIPALFGTAGLIWGMSLHAAESAEGIEWELDKSYLLMRGPYAFSRHPMYVSELILLFGWVIFYGSLALVIALVLWCLVFSRLAPNEERVLEAHFGEAYRQYKKVVPRWLGPPRRKGG